MRESNGMNVVYHLDGLGSNLKIQIMVWMLRSGIRIYGPDHWCFHFVSVRGSLCFPRGNGGEWMNYDSTTHGLITWWRWDEVPHLIFIERLTFFIQFFYLKRIMGHLSKAFWLWDGRYFHHEIIILCHVVVVAKLRNQILLISGFSWFLLYLSWVSLHFEVPIYVQTSFVHHLRHAQMKWIQNICNVTYPSSSHSMLMCIHIMCYSN